MMTQRVFASNPVPTVVRIAEYTKSPPGETTMSAGDSAATSATSLSS